MPKEINRTRIYDYENLNSHYASMRFKFFLALFLIFVLVLIVGAIR